MKKLFIFIFLFSCSSINSSTNSTKTSLVFKDSLSFDDFSELLIEYAKISPYPNIFVIIYANGIEPIRYEITIKKIKLICIQIFIIY